MEEKIFAEVNGNKITQKEVNSVLANMDPRRAAQYQNDQGYKQIAEELIRQELIYADAVENKLNQEEEFINQLEQVKKDILKQYAVNKLLSSVAVGDEEIREYYEENKGMFLNPPSVKASHILVDTEEQATKIYEEIENGMKFGVAATAYSKCPSKENGGDLGYFGPRKMVKEFEDAAFSMNIGEISKPVKTQFGYHLIHLTDKTEAVEKNLSEVKEPIKRQLTAEKQNRIYTEKTEELKAKFEVKLL